MRTKTNTRERVKFSDIVEPPVASYSQHLLRRYTKRSQREREREIGAKVCAKLIKLIRGEGEKPWQRKMESA